MLRQKEKFNINRGDVINYCLLFLCNTENTASKAECQKMRLLLENGLQQMRSVRHVQSKLSRLELSNPSRIQPTRWDKAIPLPSDACPASPRGQHYPAPSEACKPSLVVKT